MSSNPRRLQYLFQKYLHDEVTPDEIREFWKLFSELEEEDPVKQDLWQLWNKEDNSNYRHTDVKDWDIVLKNIRQKAAEWERDQPLKIKRRFPVWRMAAAVAVFCLLTIGGYVWIRNKNIEKKVTQAESLPVKKRIKPGGNKAVLILANGQTVFLDSANQGQLAIQGGSKIIKIKNGLLAYNGQSIVNRQSQIQYNTIKTPRGGKYQLVLSDGTKVWLNASSSIRFPVAFTGNERKVEITGEVYFEVATNAKRPFKIKSKSRNIEINVLGTSFNMNTYKDEPSAKITLLEGSLKVIQQTTHRSKLLQPGQQAQVEKDDDIKILDHVNTNEVIAWKNNLFWFDDADIQTVMRQISRWYDVDVKINGKIPQHFTGSIPRNLMVSDVFKVLNRTGKINFKIEDKKIIVSPLP